MAIDPKLLELLAESLTQITMIGYAIGRAHVFGWVDAAMAEDPNLAAEIGWQLAEVDVEGVFNLPFDKAVEFFVRKGILTKADFEAELDTLKPKYFTVARIDEDFILEIIKGKVQRALEEGVQVDEFLSELDDLWQATGLDPLEQWHAELVYFQNIQSAHHAGHYEAMFDPDVMRVFELLTYITVEDSRVREEHQALHNVTLPITDPRWEIFYPPNGYRCRCSVYPSTKRQAATRKIREIPEKTKSGKPVLPDEGFRSNPAGMFREVPK